MEALRHFAGTCGEALAAEMVTVAYEAFVAKLPVGGGAAVGQAHIVGLLLLEKLKQSYTKPEERHEVEAETENQEPGQRQPEENEEQ